jgi:hypothetical protein
MSTDPFEEFEFKPLTEGLGFHKKAEQLKTSVQASSMASEKLARSLPVAATVAPHPPATSAKDSISKLIASLPPSFGSPHLDFVDEPPMIPQQSKSSVNQPLLQASSTLAATPALAPVTAASLAPAPTLQPPMTFKKTDFQARLDESFAKAFPKAAAQTTAKVKKALPKLDLDLDTQPLTPSLPAALLDALVVLGVSTLGLVIILLITKVDLIAMLSSAQADGPTQLHLALLYISMLQFYMLISRSFFGATLGEWSFDAQMGTFANQLKSVYPIQIVWRTLLSTGSLFILPLLSYFLKKDLLKPLTGLQLYRRV